MKVDLSMMANIATIATCSLVAYVVLSVKSTAGPTPQERVEEVSNLRTALPTWSVKGDPRAATVIIEFTDFECPYCRQHAQNEFGAIQEEFVDTGKVRYAVRQFPLDIHPAAYDAAKAVLCADEQQQYWAMHEQLFAIQGKMTLAHVDNAADAIGIMNTQFDACMNAVAQRVEADVTEARRLGIASTPTFLVGTADDAGNVHVKRKIRGASDASVFRQVIAEVTGSGGR